MAVGKEPWLKKKTPGKGACFCNTATKELKEKHLFRLVGGLETGSLVERTHIRIDSQTQVSLGRQLQLISPKKPCRQEGAGKKCSQS